MLKAKKLHCAKTASSVSHDLQVEGQKQPHIWNPQRIFAYSVYNFYGATTTIKGSL